MIDRFLHSVKRLVPARAREALRRATIAVLQRQGFRTFSFRGIEMNYLFHDYNSAWTCERAVEVPIANYFLSKADPARTIEIGNVLSHYQTISHRVIDKYEVAPEVENCDVVNIEGSTEYDLIISISTLEHVGFDETPKDPSKILLALSRLNKLLSGKGRLVVTLPIGYNPHLDQFIGEHRIHFDTEYYMRRKSALNTWQQVDHETALCCRYGYPYVAANAILIGTSTKHLT